eukprot:symbB.v1.2.033489.t1/scaffold4039.1/size45713/2
MITSFRNHLQLSKVGSTPLLGAVQAGHAAVVKYLCEAKAQFEKDCTERETCLMSAVLRNHVEVVRALCDAGANPLHPAANGTTPLFAAKVLDLQDIVGILQQYADSGWRRALRLGCGRRAEAMVSPEDVKQIMGKFGTSGGFVERARLVQVICQVTPTLSESEIELLFRKLIGTPEWVRHDLFVDAIFAPKVDVANDPWKALFLKERENVTGEKVVLHAVTTCSDWQLPLALAPLREQLEVLGAVAPVPVILEVGSTAFIAVCNAQLKEMCRRDTLDALLQELKTWT